MGDDIPQYDDERYSRMDGACDGELYDSCGGGGRWWCRRWIWRRYDRNIFINKK